MFNNIYRESDNLESRIRYQINTLKIFNDNVSEVVENEEYKVGFEIAGRQFSINVKLSPMFPFEKPSIFISPIVNHHWVSPSGEIVSAPGLLEFTVHSDLGRVVQAIIRELSHHLILNGETSPPVQSVVPLPSASCHPKPVYNASDINYDGSVYLPKESEFPELNDLSIAQLKELNENSDELNSFVENMRVKATVSKNIDDLIETTDKLAQINLNREPELEELHHELASLHGDLQVYKEKYEVLSSKYKECCDKFNPHKIIECIRQSVAEIDEECERIAESFLMGEMDLSTFIFEYINHRTISHSRKIKDEKLSQQLEKLHRAGF